MDKERNIDHREKELFSKLTIDYSRSKEDVWKSMESLMDESVPEDEVMPASKRTGRIISMQRIWINVAAAVILIAILTLGAKFYTINHDVDAGSFANYVLPDGSEVILNAESSISYAPYWWRFDRKLELTGEAFFEVEKGKLFSVISHQGTTSVLGTSFNVYAREDAYQVYCLSGMVSVTDLKGAQVVLLPGEFADLNKDNDIRESKVTSMQSVLAWRMNKFVYNTTPLSKVLEDVERHYDVRIELSFENLSDYNYTGLFERSVSAEEALKIICYSFDLEFEKKDERSFHIRQN